MNEGRKPEAFNYREHLQLKAELEHVKALKAELERVTAYRDRLMAERDAAIRYIMGAEGCPACAFYQTALGETPCRECSGAFGADQEHNYWTWEGLTHVGE